MDSRVLEQLKIAKVAHLTHEKFHAQGNKLVEYWGCDYHELTTTFSTRRPGKVGKATGVAVG